MQYTLRQAAPALGNPTAHHGGEDRIYGRFAHAHDNARTDQRDQSTRQACENRAKGPDDAAYRKALSGADDISEPAADDHEAGIGNGERRKCHADCNVVQPELVLNDGRGDRHICTVNIHDRGVAAQQPENHFRRRQDFSLRWHVASSVIFCVFAPLFCWGAVNFRSLLLVQLVAGFIRRPRKNSSVRHSFRQGILPEHNDRRGQMLPGRCWLRIRTRLPAHYGCGRRLPWLPTATWLGR